MQSDLFGTFEEISCLINLIGADGEEKILVNKKSDFQITEGDLIWEFSYACPNLGGKVIAFDKLKVQFLDTEYIIESNKEISILDAIEALNFDIKADGVHLLPNFVNEKDHVTTKSLLCLGALNTGAVYFHTFCHDVESSINLKLNPLNLVIFEKET